MKIEMKLKDARKLGIKYCLDNNCNYTYISYDNTNEYYLTDKECLNTVFLVNKNGSLDTCLSTKYSIDFHNDYKRKGNNRRRNDKRKTTEMFDYDCEYDVEE